MSFHFKCHSCGELHHGMPSFGAGAPLSYFAIPEEERSRRCHLGEDDCVIDDTDYFVRGCIEIPVHGEEEPFTWGAWVSLSEKNYWVWNDSFTETERSHLGPFFGWLNAWLKPYPETMNLKTRLHLRDNGIRPSIELEPTDHPLALEQRNGISVDRVSEIYSMMVHENET